MSLSMSSIFSAARDHLLTTGYFEHVNGHEAKNAPGNGLTADVIITNLKPIPERSGLAATSALVSLEARMYINALHEPQDDIDPNLLLAADAVFATISANYTLNGTVAEVDLLGEYGTGMNGKTGYVERNQALYRTFTFTFDCVINDVWTQGA